MSDSITMLEQKFNRWIGQKMSSMHIPGMSVVMIKDGKIIFNRGYGAKNNEKNSPVTPDTLFGVGSVTKSFTCLAIMQLWERGLLKLDDPVDQYLPLNLDQNRPPITLHHLMSMSSGLPNLGVAENIIYRFTGGQHKFNPLSGIEDLLQHINEGQSEIAADPGERMFYLNSGYSLLAEVITRVSGEPFHRFVEKNILQPLQMNRSGFAREDLEQEQDIMTAYKQDSSEGKTKITPAPHPYHPLVYGPGGLLSSTRELAHYLLFSMEGQTPAGESLLEPDRLQKMQSIHCETEDSRQKYSTFGRKGYGYGWSISEDFFGHTLVEHGGSTAVSSAYLAFIPGEKAGIGAVANVGGLPSNVLDAALWELIGGDMDEFPALKIEKRMERLTGNYENFKGTTEIKVERQGGILFYKSDMASFPLIPEKDNAANDRYYAITGPGEKLPVEFVENSSGEIDLFAERNRFRKK